MNLSLIPRSAAAALIVSTALLCGCSSEQQTTNMTASKTKALSAGELGDLSKKKIFFGHQSVGYNIVDGIGDILKDHPGITLRIVESTEPSAFDRPVFAHAAVGRNSDPESKIRDFARYVRTSAGGRADIAMFKFCYVDFEKTTDASRVFAMYRQTMEELAGSYPNTRFVHVTVPLKATSEGWKKQLKMMLGKPHPFIADNARREEFNELMRKEYKDRQPFFDLAAVESVRPDGRIACDRVNGRQIPALATEYTFDTGHLNERGRKLAAEQFLGVLAEAL